MATVYDIANFLISTSSVVGMKDMTNLKLNKLVYFVQGIYCAKTGKPLFPDSIEAWTYGPVIRALYDKYKCYGDSIITGVDSSYNENCFTNEELDILTDVVIMFKGYSASQLVELTHMQNKAWSKHYVKNHNNVIPLNDIVDDAQSILQNCSSFNIDNLESVGYRDTDGVLVLPVDYD